MKLFIISLLQIFSSRKYLNKQFEYFTSIESYDRSQMKSGCPSEVQWQKSEFSPEPPDTSLRVGIPFEIEAHQFTLKAQK